MNKVRLERGSWAYRTTRAVAGVLVSGLMRVLARTWRVEIEGPNPLDGDADGSFILVSWHRNLFVALGLFHDRGLVIPISKSRDGDWIDAVLRRMGFGESVRGSSSAGASTLLRGLIRATRAGHCVAMMPDGPRGPAGVAQPGVVALARMTGATLCPAGVSVSAAWQFGSWDRAILPRPFARVRCRFGRTLLVPKGSDGEALAAHLAELETELHQLDSGPDAGGDSVA